LASFVVVLRRRDIKRERAMRIGGKLRGGAVDVVATASRPVPRPLFRLFYQVEIRYRSR